LVTKQRTTRWCCEPFQDLVERQGKRGLSVITATIGAKDAFLLQSRAIDSDQSLSAGAHDANGIPVAITIVEDLSITFCPCCGVRLHKFYEGEINTFRRDDLKVKIG
jgi:hypothetical protein